MNYIKFIYNPSYFPFGADTLNCYPINNKIFYKKYRNEKKSIDNLHRIFYYLKLFEKYNFVPKIIHYNKKDHILLTSNCGPLLKINTLPNNWEDQLLSIKDICIKYNIIINDWGLWKINPFIINNLTLKNNKIYFVDLGDIEKGNKKQIELDFNYKINEIKTIKKWNIFYLFYHYVKVIYTSKKLSKLFLILFISRISVFFYNLLF